MVGQKTEISLAELTGKYVSKSFDECPCMTLVHDFYHDLGVDFPDSYGVYTLENYLYFWQKDPKRMIEALLDFLDTLGSSAEGAYQRFDLLAVQELQNKNIYIAIYLENNLIITSHLTVGVRVLRLGRLQKVVKARRLI